MLKSRRMAWVLAAMFVVAASIGMSGAMAASEVKIGIVDPAKVFKNAPKLKGYADELQKFKADLLAKLDIRSQNMMLDETEVQELVELKLKAVATDKEKARVTELESAERARDAEMKTLTETKDPNDTQKARLKTLQDMQQSSKTKGGELQKGYDERWSAKTQEMDAKAETDVREAIKKVAEAKGLTLVITKEAVMYGGSDISDDVIAKLD